MVFAPKSTNSAHAAQHSVKSLQGKHRYLSGRIEFLIYENTTLCFASSYKLPFIRRPWTKLGVRLTRDEKLIDRNFWRPKNRKKKHRLPKQLKREKDLHHLAKAERVRLQPREGGSQLQKERRNEKLAETAETEEITIKHRTN